MKELIDQLNSELDSREFTEVLLSLARHFDSAGSSDSVGEGARSIETQNILTSKLEIYRDAFRSNFDNGDVFYTDYDDISDEMFEPADVWGKENLFFWKPVQALWSSPIISRDEPNFTESAWTIRAENYGDAILHTNKLLKKRDTIKALCIDDVTDAINLIEKHGSFILLCISEFENGTDVIDFTWNLVFESEMAALRGELEKDTFPCGLNVESSIWLRRYFL